MSYDVDELERLEKAATDGPWEFCKYESTDREWLVQEYRDLLNASTNGTVYFVGTAEDKVAALTGNGPDSANNAMFFVKMRDALPAMIRDLREARYYKALAKSQESTIHAMQKQREQLSADLREAKEKLHLFKYAVDAAKDGEAFTADGWTMISSEEYTNLLVAKEQVKGAEELLREVEWALLGSRGSRFCPLCRAKEADGHREGCRLKAWLERTLRGSGGGEG